MPAGTVPSISLNLPEHPQRSLRPFAWRLYRWALVTGGLGWICVASSLCGCSGSNAWMKNQAGRAYYNRGKYAAARGEFERALLDNPYNATYAYNVGKAMEKEGDVSGAEKMFQHAMTLDPSHQPAYHGMTDVLLAQGRQDEATQLLTAWSQTQPYSAASHVEMAQLQRKEGNYAAAEQEINTALQLRPRYRQALNERSRLYQVTGRPSRGGAPYSELALTPAATQQAMTPQPNMVSATPQTSGALHMAATMPMKDPTLNGGAMQASFSQPQFSAVPDGTSAMMAGSAPVVHQAQMIPGGIESSSGWMPAQSNGTAAAPITMMPAPGISPQPQMTMSSQYGMQPQFGAPQNAMQPQFGAPQFAAPQMGPQPIGMAPQGYAIPANSPAPQSMQPIQVPVQLGQPVPVTQYAPMNGMPQAGFSMNEGTLPESASLAGSVTAVQAF